MYTTLCILPIIFSLVPVYFHICNLGHPGHPGHPVDIHASGALASVNLLSNQIGVEQAEALLQIKEAKPGLTTLCGLCGDETELDLSYKGLSAGCATLLAPELNANGALVTLDISNNEIGAEGAKHLAPALQEW